jgi:hypothetical protein
MLDDPTERAGYLIGASVLDYLQDCAQQEHRILLEFCVTRCCLVMLGVPNATGATR